MKYMKSITGSVKNQSFQAFLKKFFQQLDFETLINEKEELLRKNRSILIKEKNSLEKS